MLFLANCTNFMYYLQSRCVIKILEFCNSVGVVCQHSFIGLHCTYKIRLQGDLMQKCIAKMPRFYGFSLNTFYFTSIEWVVHNFLKSFRTSSVQ